MTDKEQTPIQKMFGDFSPKFAALTDDVLFGDIWARTELSPRDRSLITVAGLVAGGQLVPQLESHLKMGLANGLTEEELKEVILHMAFYVGWPNAVSALNLAKTVFAD